MERAQQLRSLLAQVLGDGDPARRLEAVAALRRELRAAETEIVAEALRAELSWSQIGAALGISKQAAHRRHSHGVAQLDRAVEAEHHGGRVRVSAEVRRAVRLARHEAAAAGRRSVGTEHLLLGLLRCGEPQTTALLGRLGCELEQARQAAAPTAELPICASAGAPAAAEGANLIDEGGAVAPAHGAAVLSPLARRVLERALAQRSRDGGALQAPDLLDALLRDDRGGAARTLQSLGIEPAAARLELTRATAVSDPPLARSLPAG